MFDSHLTLHLNKTQSFHYHDAKLGAFCLRMMQPEQDSSIVHQWCIKDYARFWNMQDFDQPALKAFYQDMQLASDTAVFIGMHEDQPAFLVEIYDPALHPLAAHYQWQSGDVGMHLLIAPPVQHKPDFTLTVMRVVLQYIFSQLQARRVVVEPDIRNHKMHRLNERVGFQHLHPIQLEQKTALLGLCDEAHFFASLLPNHDSGQNGFAAVTNSHLTPHDYAQANQLLLRKIIAEFSHEQLLTPVLCEGADDKVYQLATDNAGEVYRFCARKLPLDHWLIDASSIERTQDNQSRPLSAIEFLISFRRSLPISDEDFLLYLEEVSSTLSGSCYKRNHGERSAGVLCHADYQTVEAAMSEGHPTFVANNGRIGFSGLDYRQFAPETAAKIQLVWLAAHRSKAHFSCIDGLNHQQLLDQEIDGKTLQKWREHLQLLGLSDDDYYFMPVHPWQWQHKIVTCFAGELAERQLVYLGTTTDLYQPQQSIRTYYNTTAPHRSYVKTALSILNMGFMRGLSPEYMRTTPAINQWVDELLRNDTFLMLNGFSILREVAAIGYHHPTFRPEVSKGSAYGKMLSALWRESPKSRLKPGENLMTMASLLHIDPQGDALLARLIERSGQTAQDWISDYLEAYLTPLLHCFYAYDLCFMPHGENLIMVLKDGAVQRMIMKDIGEEIGIVNGTIELPEAIARITFKVNDELKADYIFTDIFDGFFRYLAAILDEYQLLPAEEFWAQVAKTIHRYQQAQPELSVKYRHYDLFVEKFVRNCYNRLQLRNNRQMLDLQDQTASFQYAEPLDNPIAVYR